ncbi:MAG TPA: efflux RND transporter periplasmic adaptor subunit [Terracidiphilus sp.]|nr:efflux RND transporter periplasmic adaptor subunit [Terracidiphilus sp.]
MTTSTWTGSIATRRSHIGKWHVAVLAGAAVLVAGIIYSLNSEKVEVRVISPTFQDIASTISTTGAVSPVKDFTARANFSGMVQTIYVHLGQQVHAGQMVILMKDQFADSRLVAARAALEASEVSEQNVQMNGSQEDRISFAADLVRAQSEQTSAASAYSTLQELAKRGSVSEAEVQAGRQRLQAADASLQALNDRTRKRYSDVDIKSWKDKVAADKASLAAEKVSYANAHIATPISGTVYVLPVSQYDFVNMGSELLHVADLRKIQVHAGFDELDIGKLRVGEQVAITWDGKPGQTWNGRISQKPLALTHSADRNVGQCTIDIDNPKADLPIGTNVAVIVTDQKHSHALTVPRLALHTEGAAHFVYRVAGGKLLRTPVDIGIVNPMQAEITKGIEPQDVIAMNATDDHKLSDDLRVTTTK